MIFRLYNEWVQSVGVAPLISHPFRFRSSNAFQLDIVMNIFALELVYFERNDKHHGYFACFGIFFTLDTSFFLIIHAKYETPNTKMPYILFRLVHKSNEDRYAALTECYIRREMSIADWHNSTIDTHIHRSLHWIGSNRMYCPIVCYMPCSLKQNAVCRVFFFLLIDANWTARCIRIQNVIEMLNIQLYLYVFIDMLAR